MRTGGALPRHFTQKSLCFVPRLRSLAIAIVALSTFVGTSELKAQDENNDPVSKQLWLDFNPSLKVTDRLTLYGAIGARTIFPTTWSRYLITPSVKYNWPRMILKDMKFKEELHGGIGFYYTENSGTVDRLEIRPFQAYSLTAPNRYRLQVKHLLKLEERFEMETDDWASTFGLRLRYSATVTFRFHGKVWAKGNGFFIPATAEFFWNLKGTKQFNDKIRLLAGIGRDITPDWKALFLFGYFYSKAAADDPFNSNEMLFRLRVYHTFHKKNSK